MADASDTPTPRRPGLLDSQLATLEDPSGEPGVVTVDIDASVEAIVADAFDGLAALR